MKDRIKRLMESQHMNQQSFANYIGVAPATLNSILRERTRPTLDTVNSICKSMPHVNPLWLLNGTGEMFLTTNPASGSSPEVQNGGSAADGAGASPSSDGSLYSTQPASGSASAPSPAAQGQHRSGASAGTLSFVYDDEPATAPAGAYSGNQNGQRRMQQRQDGYSDNTKKIDKPSRRITEIRVFYDDQTWESFVPKK